MRPHLVTSAVFSLSRLSTASAIATTTTTTLKALTCSPQRFFTTTTTTTKPQQCPFVKPQAKTYTTMAGSVKTGSILDLIKVRRTHYGLNKELPVSKDRIQEIVKEALAHVPSSFNSQSNRVLVLFGAEHDKFWNFATDILKTIVPEDQWKHTADRMAMFKGAAGSVLFFEDEEVVKGMQAKFPLYSDKFPIWALQSDAMLQHVVWTALTAEGLGANLQHYNPLVDAKVVSEWGIPENWKLNAQLVFGGRTGEAGPKEFKPIEEIFRVAGA
ncbi:type II nitroreductase [Parahypoxylon ruwenzoriense]